MRTYKGMTGLALLAAATMGACSSVKQAALGDASIVITPNPATMNQTVKIETSDPAIKALNWSITNAETSLSELGQCQIVDTGLSCNFDVAGRKLIHLSAADPENTTLSLDARLDVLDPGAASNQPPLLVLDIKDSSQTRLATIATVRSYEWGTARFVHDAPLTFDFSRTHDDRTALDQLRIEIDATGSGNSYRTITGKTTTQTFTTLGEKTIRVRLTDNDGASSETTFFAYIGCSTAEMQGQGFNLDGAKISVSKEGTYNYFQFDGTTVASGTNIGTLLYSWDLNGDGVFDNKFSTSNGRLTHVYTNYAGTRMVGLKIMENRCFSYLSTSKPVRFDIEQPALPDLNDAQGGDYFFVRGDISSTTQGPNVNVNTNQLKTQGLPIRVECTYNKYSRKNEANTAIYVSGFNRYEWDNGPGAKHGLELHIVGVNDGIKTGNGTINTSAASIDWINYWTDESKDSVSRHQYTKAGACNLSVSVKALTNAAGTCSDQVGENKVNYRILGTYSCPLFEGTKTANLTNGAFYCEVGDADACVGGSSSSPGNNPTPY